MSAAIAESTPETARVAGAVAVGKSAGDSLSILMVTPEAHPFAKTGGLAEVAAALPQALAALGHNVTLVLPRYRGVDVVRDEGAADRVHVRESARSRWRSSSNRRRTAFRASRSPSSTHRTSSIERDCTATQAATIRTTPGDSRCSAARRSSTRARARYGRRVIHAHDWQTGLVPVYQKMVLSTDPDRRRRSRRVHDSQPGLPGAVPGTDGRFDWPGLGGPGRPGDGVLGPDQLPQSGDQLQRADHHRQPDLRGGDHDAGARVRLRRDPPAARERPGRDPQRHRHDALEPRARRVRAGVVLGRRSERQTGRQARAPRGGRHCIATLALRFVR